MQPNLKATLAILIIGALVLMYAGFYNGYPLVTSDSGTYINSGFELTVPDDRPIIYGLFLRLFSLKFSLWLPVFIQNLILAGIIWEFIRSYFASKFSNLTYLGCILVISFFTGISWFSSQLMPDIFTALAILLLTILLLNRNLSTLKYSLYSCLLVFCLIVHVSNLVSALMLYLLFSLFLILFKKYRPEFYSLKRHLVTGLVVLSGWLILPAIHAGFGSRFAVSNSSHVFLMARLVENGILDHYLAHNCNESLKICAYKDQLPNNTINFIWDQNSPLYKTGGWEANREEYNNIIKATYTSPFYLAWHISEAVQATFRQLTHNNIGDGLFPNVENSNPFWKVQQHFPFELKEYLSSLQNRNELKFDNLNNRYLAVLILSAMILLAYFKVFGLTSAFSVTSLCVLLGIFCNATVSATLGNVLDRLQGRVIWLLPVLAIIAATELGNYFRQKAKVYFNNKNNILIP